ncbi:hypothetical protein Ahy_Scaffold6g107907 [Arachis hypogaea]|uniref:Leucine-rich repeat-containing N-terminal plant-type domain-containing protein n=1 Tax=Arachis hypogaea TaxID=3818 RepID=A0A444WPQ0_ARAHY|nr:hypothetical protein Ahy_Scaffold6g107907 [Arachis hypogaea]
MTMMGLLHSVALSTQFLLLFSSSLFTNCLTLNDSTSTHHHGCHQHENNALLSFKQSFIISKLEQLRLNFVTISSSLPHTLTNLTSLQKLSFRNCELYGEFPVGIFYLPNLTSLNFAENQNLQGALPASIGNLTNLALLALGDNSFHGEIPQSLFRLENLEQLSLSYNFFEGQLALDMFLKLKMLNALGLSVNKLTLFSQNRNVNVTILPPIQSLGLSGLENLTVLDLSHNTLEGQIELDMLSKLQKLTSLGLGGGNKLYFLEGKNSSNVTFPSQIQTLILGSCNLVHFPNFTQHLQELTDLYLSNNTIKTIPSWLWNKTTLQTLVISNSLLIGEISPSICNLQSLVVLDLSSNNLVGMIPSCLGTFSRSLQVLDLAANKLIGNIPQTYVKGNALQFIDFSSNKLYGQLPRTLVNCRMLEFLDVRHNHFNDSFPFWLGSLPKLKVVFLSDNQFHGAIMCPLKYTFPQLRIIDLSQNGLTFLDFLNVFFNNLSGPIPKNGQLSTFDENSFKGNKYLCGIRLLKKCEDHPKLPLQKPDGDQDSESGSFFELYWMVIIIGYGGGLVAGLALGNAFAVDVYRLLKKIF